MGCILVCTMKGAGEVDTVQVFTSGDNCDNEVALVPAFASGLRPGYPVQKLGLKEGVGNAQLVHPAHYKVSKQVCLRFPVGAYPCIAITEENEVIVLRYGIDNQV